MDYRYDIADMRAVEGVEARTLYVVGGLYGNPQALRAVLAMQAAEERTHGALPRLVFNGDFNWFDVAAEDFRRVNDTVLAHDALRGNVETELGRPGEGADCGCNYPTSVEEAVVQRSNRIFTRLAETASAAPELRARLAALPMWRVYRVGPARVGVVHGDAESLAGWRFDAAALRAVSQGEAPAERAVLGGFLDRAGVDAFACTHTCLPAALRLEARQMGAEGKAPGGVIINNGAAGMPNFRGRHEGLITRISADATPHPLALYGTTVQYPGGGAVRYEALPLPYDHAEWLRVFARHWPEGTPAHLNYHGRILHGPEYGLEDAVLAGFTPMEGSKPIRRAG